MALKTLKDIKVKNKLVLLRIDINSPIVEGRVEDNPRFEESAKTIRYLLQKKARVVIIAHQGRQGSSDFLPLEQHARILSKYAKANIEYINYLFEKEAELAIKDLKSGKAVLLKNVRNYKDETDLSLPNYERLCSHFDFYVNEAFSVSHREQGSIILPPRYLKSAIGLQFENEISALSKITLKEAKNLTIILGGAKVEDYLPLFNLLRNNKNKMLTAGVLANLLIMTKGKDLGYESAWVKNHDYLPLMPKLQPLYSKYSQQITLPLDFGLMTEKSKREDVTIDQAPYKYKILDIGPKTVALFKREINSSKFIFMKGPLGYSEFKEFGYATKEILSYLSLMSKKKKIFVVLGGGHLTTTMHKYKIPNTFAHISLSGGALITYLSGEELPGLVALEKSNK